MEELLRKVPVYREVEPYINGTIKFFQNIGDYFRAFVAWLENLFKFLSHWAPPEFVVDTLGGCVVGGTLYWFLDYVWKYRDEYLTIYGKYNTKFYLIVCGCVVSVVIGFVMVWY